MSGPAPGAPRRAARHCNDVARAARKAPASVRGHAGAPPSTNRPAWGSVAGSRLLHLSTAWGQRLELHRAGRSHGRDRAGKSPEAQRWLLPAYGWFSNLARLAAAVAAFSSSGVSGPNLRMASYSSTTPDQ